MSSTSRNLPAPSHGTLFAYCDPSHHFLSLIALVVLPGILSSPLAAQNLQLVWSDEFNGAANTSPASQNWGMALGGGGWGNQELQTNTSSTDNVFQDGNGNLVIRAIKTSTGYTSGRLTTQATMLAGYGKVEARIKLPVGKGIWPAFWMLGYDAPTVGWPNCGEIDIMEGLGDQQAYTFSTLHGPNYSGNSAIGASYRLPSGQFSDGFHTFGVVWKPNSIEFQLDSVTYSTMTPASLPAGAAWVFNKPFYLMLNLSVGGTWPGYPDATTVFPQSMVVDYVRYYRDVSYPTITPGQVLDTATFTQKLSPGSTFAIAGNSFSSLTSGNLLVANQLPVTFDGASVLVNSKNAPLISVSPSLIIAQIPWSTPTGTTINVQVVRNGVASNIEKIKLAVSTPGVFLQDGAVAPWCLAGTTKAGTTCAMFGSGFGPKVTPLQDGVPAPSTGVALKATCRLKIANINATISYCGAAPGLLIDRLNFVYPAGVPKTPALANAVLTIGNQNVSFPMPAPTQ